MMHTWREGQSHLNPSPVTPTHRTSHNTSVPAVPAHDRNHTPNTLTARTHLTQVVLFSNSSCTDTYSTVQLPFDFSGYLPPAANGSVVTALSWATLVATAFLKSPAQQGTNATAAMVESLMQVSVGRPVTAECGGQVAWSVAASRAQ